MFFYIVMLGFITFYNCYVDMSQDSLIYFTSQTFILHIQVKMTSMFTCKDVRQTWHITIISTNDEWHIRWCHVSIVSLVVMKLTCHVPWPTWGLLRCANMVFEWLTSMVASAVFVCLCVYDWHICWHWVYFKQINIWQVGLHLHGVHLCLTF